MRGKPVWAERTGRRVGLLGGWMDGWTRDWRLERRSWLACKSSRPALRAGKRSKVYNMPPYEQYLAYMRYNAVPGVVD